MIEPLVGVDSARHDVYRKPALIHTSPAALPLTLTAPFDIKMKMLPRPQVPALPHLLSSTGCTGSASRWVSWAYWDRRRRDDCPLHLRTKAPIWTRCNRTSWILSTSGNCTRRAGKLERVRSRLYRSQNLQQNMHWKALAEIYTMHSFAPFWILNFLFKNR